MTPRRSGLLRWAVPTAVLAAAVSAATAGGVLAAGGDPPLPRRDAAQLLVDLQTARVDGLSGTVVQRADLGIPALPTGGGQGSSELSSLVAGSHTLRVWYAGPDKARLALLGSLGESDVVLNGRDLWTWSSQQNAATHRTLPARPAGGLPSGPGPGAPSATPSLPGALTPQDAARRALEAVQPSTSVTTTGTAEVAGRKAYELVLAPKDTRSLVGQVRIAVDAEQKVALRVRVFAKGANTAAAEVGFTRVSFTRPGDEQFRFTPPKGAKVTEAPATAPGAKDAEDAAPDRDPAGRPTVIGTGWTSVVVARGVDAGALLGGSRNGGGRGEDGAGAAGQLGQVLSSLPRVSGAWGSGRLLRSTLFSALLTDDGRLVVGAVTPEQLYAAAADPAAAAKPR